MNVLKNPGKTSFLLLLSCWMTVSAGFGQDLIPISFPIEVEGETLDLPWLGGLNNPQPAVADLNGDGETELYLFDRTGGVHLGFVRDESSPTGWTWAPDLTDSFPEVQEWVILKDYNEDGAPDLFAYSDIPGIGGVIVFQGRFRNGKLVFDRLDLKNNFGVLVFTTSLGSELNILISSIDYPAIADADCDGDLDILTFDFGGTKVEFYRNLSVERGYGKDSLIFLQSTNCWGGFAENGENESLLLSAAPGLCASFLNELEGRTQDPRHSGSTLLVFDRDGDGLQDLLLGDITFPSLTFLKNEGSCFQAWMGSQVIGFPDEDRSVDIPFFPAAFFEDVNGDGREDLLAAPNAKAGAEDVDVLWYYTDEGTEEGTEFSFVDSAFLSSEMVDLGTGAFPTFADVNQDGLLDMLVGNQSRSLSDSTRISELVLFLNTGSRTAPSFELAELDYLGLSQFNNRSSDYVPAFGDLDQDGDQDLLVGEIGGTLFFAENIAGPGQAMQFAAWQEDYLGIDVGEGSAPQLVDLNRDDLLDLVIGERAGNLNFFPNQGQAGSPVFEPDPDFPPNNSFFGGVDSRKPNSNFFAGFCTPWFFEMPDGWHLLTGSQDNGLEHYTEVEENLTGSFLLLEDEFRVPNPGYRTRPAIIDIDNDGFLELIVGNQRGGLSWFQTSLMDEITSNREPTLELPVQLFPNPASQAIQLDFGNTSLEGEALVRDMTGRLLLRQSFYTNMVNLGIGSIPDGVYTLQLRTDKGQKTMRFIKQ